MVCSVGVSDHLVAGDMFKLNVISLCVVNVISIVIVRY